MYSYYYSYTIIIMYFSVTETNLSCSERQGMHCVCVFADEPINHVLLRVKETHYVSFIVIVFKFTIMLIVT